MTISAVSGNSTNLQQSGGIGQKDDAYTRSIKKQIESVQKELQELSNDAKMSFEEKIKERQELQQEIANLNAELRQHQAEVRRKEQQEREQAAREQAIEQQERHQASEQAGQPAGRNVQEAAVSTGAMQSVISADVSMGQVRVASQAKSSLDGMARVLRSEIRQDAGRGGSQSGAKAAALSDVELRADSAASAEAGALFDIQRSLREVGNADSAAAARKSDSKGNEEDGSVGKTDAQRGEDGPVEKTNAHRDKDEAAVKSDAQRDKEAMVPGQSKRTDEARATVVDIKL